MNDCRWYFLDDTESKTTISKPVLMLDMEQNISNGKNKVLVQEKNLRFLYFDAQD